MNQLAQVIVSLAVLGIVVYGLCWMVGGRRLASNYARGLDRTARRGVRSVGRGTGRLAMRYPLVAGIIVLLIVLSRC